MRSRIRVFEYESVEEKLLAASRQVHEVWMAVASGSGHGTMIQVRHQQIQLYSGHQGESAYYAKMASMTEHTDTSTRIT